MLYYAPQSRAETVLWALEEIGAPYEKTVYDLSKKEHKNPTYLAINPFGKVPTLVVDDVVITECAAILAFLGDEFPEKKLAPKVGDKHRGAYFRWLFIGPSVMEPAMMYAYLKVDNKDNASAAGWAPLGDVLTLLTDTLKRNQFLSGGDFSMADMAFSSTLSWTMMWGMVPKEKLYEDYVQRCFARPSKERANQISAEIMKQRA